MTLSHFSRSWQDADPNGKYEAARQLWRGMGIAVIFPGQVHGMDRDWVEAFGNRVYGRNDG